MKDLLILPCDVCRKPIADGTGYLTVSLAAVHQYPIDKAAWDKKYKQRGPGSWEPLSMDAMMEHPDEVSWNLYHGDCDPDRSSDDCWYAVESIRTWKALIERTAHLCEKGWFHYTDWSQFLYDLLNGSRGDFHVSAGEPY